MIRGRDRKLPSKPATLAILAALLYVAGCGGQKPTSSTTPGKGTGALSGAENEPDRRCEAIIEGLVDIFRLKRLGLITIMADGVSRMNDWRRTCAPKSPPDWAVPDAVREELTSEQINDLKDANFTQRDGEHLRDCILFKAISTYASNQPADGAANADLERAISTFEHVVRAIALIPEHEGGLPLTAYEVYLLGRGTSEDRAWIFANVLRQSRIDSVLLRPKRAEDDDEPDERKSLVGVLLDDRVYLFDPQAGVPVPAGEAANRTEVATLAQAIADPAVLTRLAVGDDAETALTPDDLRRLEVSIIGDTGFWSLRMLMLQSEFSGPRAMTIADPLGETADGTGAWQRVVRAGGKSWDEGNVTIWDYPETQLAAHLELTTAQQKKLEDIIAPFDAYLRIEIDPRNGQIRVAGQEETIDPVVDKNVKVDRFVRNIIRTTRGAQMRTRLTQLNGEFAQAVQGYTEVRKESKPVAETRARIPDVLREMHQRAIDDASFWTGVCKYEQGNYDVAAQSFRRYLDQQVEGAWVRQARFLWALSLAGQNEFAEAIDLLDAFEADDPEYAGFRIRIARWKASQLAEREAGDDSGAP